MDVPTSADGTFSLELNPGTYRVTGHSPLYGGDKGLCRAYGDVVIRSGTNNVVTVACDMK